MENGKVLQRFNIQKQIRQPYSDIITEMNTTQLSSGVHQFYIHVHYKIGDKEKICVSDNHRGTSHNALSVNISDDLLPRIGPCLYGETHCHTNYTSDQVEFGASVSSTAHMTAAQGLDFYCATDHSYDMDDFEDNYLKNDPKLKKWENFKIEVQKNNEENRKVLIIPGEEVTVRNSRQQNVHLLVYNSDKFFPGSGDSGEKWFKTYSEAAIADITRTVEHDVACFAAHPAETPPLLQKLFINRGEWQTDDCRVSGLNGLQFINGGENKYKIEGRKLWVEQLLAGYKLIGLAGNDSHGNFSKFRQVGFPFFTMRENDLHLFGKWRTGVYMDDKVMTIKNVLNQMVSGNCFLSNGPALQMKVQSQGAWYPMGSFCIEPSILRIELLSTPEFSTLQNIRIFIGDINRSEEKSLFKKEFGDNIFHTSNEITLSDLPAQGYLRAEVRTLDGFESLSNPIWFDSI